MRYSFDDLAGRSEVQIAVNHAPSGAAYNRCCAISGDIARRLHRPVSPLRQADGLPRSAR
jgi:hypothetical protein